MISIFNRKELIISTDMILISKIREQLMQSGIEHKVIAHKTVCSFNRRDTPFVKLDNTIEYRIFVHRKDYEQASYVRRTM